MQAQEVYIAGGGVGGLSAALCLAERGIASLVFERAEEFTEVGAGLQLSPNCTRVLYKLGLSAELKTKAVYPTDIQIKSWQSGDVLEQSALGKQIESETGFPYCHIHRADLIDILLDAAQANNLITLHKGEAVNSFSQANDDLKVVTSKSTYKAKALIGADGISSCIRDQICGQQPAKYTGNVAWRALVPSSALEGMPQQNAQVWWGPGKHFVRYYVRGGEFVNCVCVIEKAAEELESWHQLGDVNELKKAFKGWDKDILHLLNNVDESGCFKTALFDRAPLDNWSKAKVTLLGDACHPTLPFMAQGAAMAIEDGATLAFCLDEAKHVDAALLRYQGIRMARTAKLQRWARRNAKIFHLSGMPAWARNQVMALNPAGKVLDEVYQHDVYALSGKRV